MIRALLVTGSRTLATRPGAEAWARGLIREALDGVGLLIVGDAPGPDAWAAEAAVLAGVRVHRYDTHGPDAGWITVPHGGELWRIGRWATPAMQGRRFPLHRNAAVRCAAQALAMTPQWSARVLALLDGRKDARACEATAATCPTVLRAEEHATARALRMAARMLRDLPVPPRPEVPR